MNIGIFPSANSTKKTRDVKLEISVCSRIMRLTNNQTKKPKKGYYSQKRRENDDKNAVAICVSQDSDALVSQRGKQSPGNPMQNVLGSIRKVRFIQSTLRQASIREKKGPWFGKVQVKNPHQRSPYVMKFGHWSHEKTERDNSDAPEARRGTLPKTFTSSKRMTKRHSTRRGRMGTYSRLHEQKSRSKESL